jgi:hypothetical protein
MPRMHDGYPCTGRDMYGRWGYILWDRLCRACMMNIHVQVEICTPIHTSQERLCTVLSYYNYSQYILPSNVYVQISLIWLRTIHTPQGRLYSSSLLLWLYLIHPSQERLCTVLSYYDYSQYILSRNVYVCTVLSYYDYDYSQYILPRNVYVHFCGERRLVIKFKIV